MIQRFRQLALSALFLPLALTCHAAGGALPAKVEQALKANKISNHSLAVVTLLATMLPARRAARTHPAVVLRGE